MLCCDVVVVFSFHLEKTIPTMLQIREASDLLETLVPSKSWLLPTYHEMLFHQD